MNCGPKKRYNVYLKTADGGESFLAGDFFAYSPHGAVEAWLASNAHVDAPTLYATVTNYPYECSLPRLYHFTLERQSKYKIEAAV